MRMRYAPVSLKPAPHMSHTTAHDLVQGWYDVVFYARRTFITTHIQKTVTIATDRKASEQTPHEDCIQNHTPLWYSLSTAFPHFHNQFMDALSLWKAAPARRQRTCKHSHETINPLGSSCRISIVRRKCRLDEQVYIGFFIIRVLWPNIYLSVFYSLFFVFRFSCVSTLWISD